jgi:hypothetical protein
MQSKKIEVQCECGSYSRPSVDQLLAHLGKMTGLTPDFFRSSNAHSLYQSKPCGACDGKGFINVADGPDDFQKVDCEACHGRGRVVGQN